MTTASTASTASSSIRLIGRPQGRAASPGPCGGGLQRRRRLVAPGQGGPGHAGGRLGALRHRAVTLAGRCRGGGLPLPGRGVESALGGRADQRDGGRGVRRQRPGPLRPLQVRADGCARPARRGRRRDRRARGERQRPGRPPSGPGGRGGGRRRLPPGRGRLHQGRHPALVPGARAAHLGQAGGGLPGLAPALRDAGDAGSPGRRRSSRIGAALARLRAAAGAPPRRCRPPGGRARRAGRGGGPPGRGRRRRARRGLPLRRARPGRLPVRQPEPWPAPAGERAPGDGASEEAP